LAWTHFTALKNQPKQERKNSQTSDFKKAMSLQ